MANPKRLAILQLGVGAWNEWKGEHPDTRVDLSEADLSQADLSRAFLSRADLSSADLIEAILGGAILQNTRLHNTNFSKAHVALTVFADVNLRDAKGLETVEHRGPSNIG